MSKNCCLHETTLPPAGLKNDFCFDYMTKGIQKNIEGLTEGGWHYMTPQICRELKHIHTGVTHIRLDHDFLNNNMWNNMCDKKATAQHKEDVNRMLERTSCRLCDFTDKMTSDNIHSGYDNEIREAHQVTIQDLKGIQRDMSRLTHKSIDRIKEYCDQSGVTDRYTGYRNNLNRGNRRPIMLDFSWLRPENSPEYTNIRVKNVDEPSFSARLCRTNLTNTGSNAPKEVGDGYCCCCNDKPCSCDGSPAVERPLPPRTIQEECGINTVFPGITEYLQSYTDPSLNAKITHYNLNPRPDYNINGRTVAKGLYTKMESEYGATYIYPDVTKLPKLPWLKE